MPKKGQQMPHVSGSRVKTVVTDGMVVEERLSPKKFSTVLQERIEESALARQQHMRKATREEVEVYRAMMTEFAKKYKDRPTDEMLLEVRKECEAQGYFFGAFGLHILTDQV